MQADSEQNLGPRKDPEKGAGEIPCRICGAEMKPAGTRYGKFAGRWFKLGRCSSCGFAAVTDPWLDYAAIYNDAYYAGRGADPHVDYLSALVDPTGATQRYEWEGILRRITSLVQLDDGTRWLDYGCGVGGLVSYLHSHGYTDTVGLEQGWSLARLKEHNIPHIEDGDLDRYQESFDVVTAIEVLEHSIDPLAELRKIRLVMKPGGMLFVTTGNAAPYAARLGEWQYVIPEVHVSFFEPRTLAFAFREAGFEARFPGYGSGWDYLYRAKLLRTLGVRRRTHLEELAPWSVLSRLLEWKFRLAEQPIGIAMRS